MLDPTLVPLITVFGPIIGATIGAVITYYVVVKRKRLTIYYTQTDKLEEPLHQYHPFRHVEPKPMVPGTLQHAYIAVKNTGNAAIKDLVIEARSMASYFGHLAVFEAKDENLSNAISAEWFPPDKKTGVRVKLTVPYLNPRESFMAELIWEGTDDDLSVYCRLEDVEVESRQTERGQAFKLADPFDKTRFKRIEKQVERWEQIKNSGKSRSPIERLQ